MTQQQTIETLITKNTTISTLLERPNQQKTKILVLSDMQISTSGVGLQAKYLIEGLLKTGRYSFRCFGGAMKHLEYKTMFINPDFIIKPVDGFGTQQEIRHILYTERPDAILIITDPRQFIWLWEMEDEIHQICPIAYWHVWDNDPYPDFNKVWYESTDLINCLSHKTYELVKPHFPEKTNYIPHAFPNEVFFKLPENDIKELRQKNFGEMSDWFIALWVNRNATRKMPSDLLVSWKSFLDKLQTNHGHKKALLIMHTDPTDQEGPNLLYLTEKLNIQKNIVFSTEKINMNDMNALCNIADCGINISRAEGFGLLCLQMLQIGKPIIVSETGGHIRQIRNNKTGFEHGIGIKPAIRNLIGSQMVPAIYDDYVSTDDVSEAIYKLWNMPKEQRNEIGQKASEYVQEEFNYETMITNWDKTLTDCINNFKTNKTKQWSITELEGGAKNG